MNRKQATWAERVAKLLAKAESTDSMEEAEALYGKAQEIMTRHAIDVAMVEAARDGTKPETIVTAELTYTGIYRQAFLYMGFYIADANRCRALQSRDRKRHVPGKKRLETYDRLTVIGFESDVELVKILDASLQLQAARAMKRWSSDPHWDYAYHSRQGKFAARREFIYSFGRAVRVRLDDANRRAEREAQGVATPGTSVALVLKSRRARVDDWMDERYGPTRTARRSYRNYGGAAAASAGAAAGKRADVGNPAVAARRALKG